MNQQAVGPVESRGGERVMRDARPGLAVNSDGAQRSG